jgi:hypothetical protein
MYVALVHIRTQQPCNSMVLKKRSAVYAAHRQYPVRRLVSDRCSINCYGTVVRQARAAHGLESRCWPRHNGDISESRASGYSRYFRMIQDICFETSSMFPSKLKKVVKDFHQLLDCKITSSDCFLPTTMPTNAVIKRSLSAQMEDSSKTLGVILNGKAITTGQYIPRAGKPHRSFTYLPISQPNRVLRGPNSSPDMLSCP